MKWEYGMLYDMYNSYPIMGREPQTIFRAPDGSHDLKAIGHIAALNQLGQEGWEAYSAQLRGVDSGSFEYYYWLKRPVTN